MKIKPHASVARTVLAAAITAAGLFYGTAELFAESATAALIQQPAPGTCCRFNSECNSGWECKERKGSTCSPYSLPFYCERVNTGGEVIPGGGSQ